MSERREIRSHLGILDAQRGIAAILVAWAHLSPPSPYAPKMAGVCVDLFFILSGYVIPLAYEKRLIAGLSAPKFLLARFGRLYPMYFIGVLVSVILMVSFPIGRSMSSAVLQLLMLPSPKSTSLYPMNGPAWSLMFELIVNALYALTWRFWTLRSLALVIGVAGLSLAVTSLNGMTLDAGWNWTDLATGVCRVVFGFSAGAFIYKLHTHGYVAARLPTVALTLLAVAPAMFAPDFPEHQYRLYVVTLWLPLVVFASVGAGKPPSSVELSLGRLSYPLYAIHYPLFFAVSLVWPAISPRESALTAVFILAAVIIIALFFEQIWDRPIRTRIGRALVVPGARIGPA